MITDPVPLPAETAGTPIDKMNTLRDMGHFPLPVHAGATLNILVTVAATFWVQVHFGRDPLALPCWIAVVLLLNLMPVIGMRASGWRAATPIPVVERMDFFGDQHRFADWVYLAASANMAFWITLAWCAFTIWPFAWTLPAMLLLAFGCTLLPVWLRLLR